MNSEQYEVQGSEVVILNDEHRTSNVQHRMLNNNKNESKNFT